MSNDQKVDSVFHAAAEIESEQQRAAYLQKACGENSDLRARVELLLQAHADAGSFMQDEDESPATVEPSIIEEPGTQIGHYKLLQQIGEGGFGLVYMAEQTEPVRRRVALKIIKPGMDTKAVIARFEAEQQALAMMDHPNIAKVLDAGITESGRPYFVMELVKGLPVTEYCDRNHSTTKQRLQLFLVVCRAIQHAHQKGVIHRDIKPSNVMITLLDGKAVPKVIDFGVAKAINQQLTERTLFTAYGQMVGTPQYMSPEQADISGLDVDTRSDVYSLGILLYELLTGDTPLDAQRLRSVGYAQIQQIICEEEPPKPSTRVSTMGEQLAVVARDRNIEPDKLSKLLSGDLDWIVMKALDKERGRRYESASAFAADTQRYLREEPIEARPPSTSYRLRKLIRRNKGPVAAALVLVLSLLLGITGTSIGMFRAKSSKADAEREAARARNAEAAAKDHLVQVRKQRYATDKARQEAEDAQREAERNANRAEKTLAQVDVALRFADGLRLTAEASNVLNENPGLSLLLAIEGTKQDVPLLDMHNDALLAALRECREQRTIFDPSTDEETMLIRVLSAACISRDGKLVAAACMRHERAGYHNLKDDKLALVWDAESGKLITTFRVPGVKIHSLSFSPDSRLLLATFLGAVRVQYEDGEQSLYSDRVARLWDARAGEEVAVLKGHSDRVITARFSRDGTQVVTASWDKTARVWDTKSGEQRAVMTGGDYSLESAVFSADGTHVLTVPSGTVYHSRAEPRKAAA